MHMVFVSTDFEKVHFISFCNLKAKTAQEKIDWFGEYRTAILGRTNNMIDEDGDIVCFVQINTHRTTLTLSQQADEVLDLKRE